MNVEIPLGPRRALGVSVRTMIIIRSAVPAFVAHAFAPFSTQSFPSFVACARRDAASDPASASDSANPASSSPRAIGRSQRSFCAGVPCFTSIVVGMALCMPMETAMAASAAEISSSASRYVTVSSPMPSYSSGVVMPRNPSFPSSSITFLGNSHVRSHSAAKGSIFSLANSRASSTTSRCSVAVSIEPLPRFPSQPARSDHLLEQWCGAVFVLTEPALKNFHDRETDIEADEVRERQGSERMAHAQLHDLIYCFRCSDAFLHAEDRLVDHRHQHSVRHKARGVVDLDRHLAQLLRDLNHFRGRLIRCLKSTYDFDERHHGNGVHEVHADDLGRQLGMRRDMCDRNRGRVRREDRAWQSQPIEVLENLELDLGVLGRGFDNEIGTLHGIERRARLDSAKRLCSLRLAPCSLLHQASNVCLNRLERAGKRIGGDIDQRHVPALLREDVRNPVPHRAGADDGDCAHAATTCSLTADGGRLKAFCRVSKKMEPASSAIVATMPPSGPNAPPSTHTCAPGVYSTTGTWKT